MSFLCPYCGLDRAEEQCSEEHLLPAAIGAELTLDLVCADCNRRAGKEVDKPFLEDVWLRELRFRHAVPDRRGRLTGAPTVKAQLTDGSPALIRMGPGPWHVDLLPSEDQAPDGKTFRYGVAPKDEQAKLARLRKKFGNIEITSREMRSIEHPEVTFTHQQSIDLWPRFGAKVALALGRLELDDAWLRSGAARWLRDVLWTPRLAGTAPEDVGVTGLIGETIDDEVWKIANPPPEHLLWLAATDRGARVNFTLFGCRRYGVALGPQAQVSENKVWLFDPHARTVRRLAWDDWLNDVVAWRVYDASQREPGDG